jgi:hypothetical protein
MKKVVRIKESQLDGIIKKVLKEQATGEPTAPNPQEMTGAETNQDTMAGSPNDEGTEPNFDEFLTAASKLLDQGVSIGQLVDKLIDKESQGGDEETAEPEETQPDQSIPSDNQ